MVDLSWLEERLGYHFEEPELLRRALIHASAGQTHVISKEDIEHALRMSWLGDSVLDLVVSEKLYTLRPQASKESLHRWTVRLTNNKTLGRVAVDLGIQKALVIGKSVEKDTAALDKHIMLASALEAIFGAIFVDGGLPKARAVIRRVLADDLLRILEQADPGEV